MSSDKKTLYERLGGYDAITAVANDLLPRLNADPQLGPKTPASFKSFFGTPMDQDILGNIGCFTKRCFEDYYGHFGGSPVTRTCDAKKL